MLALYRSGSQAEALDVYAQARPDSSTTSAWTRARRCGACSRPCSPRTRPSSRRPGRRGRGDGRRGERGPVPGSTVERLDPRHLHAADRAGRRAARPGRGLGSRPPCDPARSAGRRQDPAGARAGPGGGDARLVRRVEQSLLRSPLRPPSSTSSPRHPGQSMRRTGSGSPSGRHGLLILDGCEGRPVEIARRGEPAAHGLSPHPGARHEPRASRGPRRGAHPGGPLAADDALDLLATGRGWSTLASLGPTETATADRLCGLVDRLPLGLELVARHLNLLRIDELIRLGSPIWAGGPASRGRS